MLRFDALREANKTRLPVFKNSKGKPAHSRSDGSDWDFSDWLMATFGEFGEAAEVRIQFSAKQISFEEYETKISKELADIQIYLDILALRALDESADIPLKNWNLGQLPECGFFVYVISFLGQLANAAKKCNRGDMSPDDYASTKGVLLDKVINMLRAMRNNDYQGETIPSSNPHPSGVDLGQATVDKFNEVSDRVKVDVKLQSTHDYGHHYAYVVKSGNDEIK